LLAYAGQTPRCVVETENIVLPLWRKQESWFAWVVNQNESPVKTTLSITPSLLEVKMVNVIRGKNTYILAKTDALEVNIPGRDALVLRL
jgi:hypothetical protein